MGLPNLMSQCDKCHAYEHEQMYGVCVYACSCMILKYHFDWLDRSSFIFISMQLYSMSIECNWNTIYTEKNWFLFAVNLMEKMTIEWIFLRYIYAYCGEYFVFVVKLENIQNSLIAANVIFLWLNCHWIHRKQEIFPNFFFYVNWQFTRAYHFQ